MKKNTKETLEERLLGIDWPNTRDGRKWSKSSPSFKRLCHFGNELLDQGLSVEKVSTMFGDLYWDAFEEFSKIPRIEEEIGEDGRTVPYFDEHQIIFRIGATDVSV